ncbi:DNA-3-methyladenine glycosylase family protein [Chitinophaga sp. 30R24]|uniref:DNA-3-methyladenine glycosylase family protein n=1 Tax=Chitinophaga sp. 30R24 TaxID=3248838 RepID=UPI003B910444
MPRSTATPEPAPASYITHLSKDKKLKTIITGPLQELTAQKNISLKLIRSIMSQQLSTKVSSVIYARFLELYGGKEPTAQQILDTPPLTLRGIGLSNAKVTYVQNVAAFVIAEKLTDSKLKKMSDSDIITYLTQIKGVGRWTVEMLLIAYLGREDIFAIDDWGLQQAMIKLYKLNREDKKAFREQLLYISAQWAPYRTHASRYLWQWKDNTPDQ